MGNEKEEKKVFVAVDLGNTKLLAMAAVRTADNHLHVIGEEEMDTPSDAIRYGMVCKVNDVANAIGQLLSKLNNRVKVAVGTSYRITKFYITVNGHTLSSRAVSYSGHQSKKVAFTAETAEMLKTKAQLEKVSAVLVENANFTLPDAQMPKHFVYELIPTEYYFDGKQALDPIGVTYLSIRANYLALFTQRALCENLHLFESQLSNYTALKRIGAKRLADVYLTNDEKQLGTAIIDFGAKCTTMAIYVGGTIAHVACLPLGGFDITRDLMTFDKRLDKAAAKMLKGLGSAIYDKGNHTKVTLPNVEGAVYEHSQIDAIINARQSEIFGYISAEIKNAGFEGKLHGGVVVTGGASTLKGFDELFKQMVCDKVRHLQIKDFLDAESEAYAKRENAMILAMLLSANTPCCESDGGKKPVKRGGLGKIFGKAADSLFGELE